MTEPDDMNGLNAGSVAALGAVRARAGGLTAFPGGDRDEWERRLFDGAYQLHDAPAVARPKCGALNLAGFVNGPAPAFGSCALMLGLPKVSTGALVEHLQRGAAFPPSFCRVLDDYIETHTHGPIGLAADAQALLIDPSYRGTTIGDCLLQAAERHRLQVIWHPGSQLTLARFPAAAPVSDDAARWQRFLAGGDATRLARRVIRECSPDGTPAAEAARAYSVPMRPIGQ